MLTRSMTRASRRNVVPVAVFKAIERVRRGRRTRTIAYGYTYIELRRYGRQSSQDGRRAESRAHARAVQGHAQERHRGAFKQPILGQPRTGHVSMRRLRHAAVQVRYEIR